MPNLFSTFRANKIPTALILELNQSSTYQMVTFMMEDGADLKLMVLVLNQLLSWNMPTNSWMPDNQAMLLLIFGPVEPTMVVLSNTILTGLLVPGPRVVAIYGRRSNLAISSGTELPLPELFKSDQISLREWEIVKELAHMPQLLKQSMPPFQTTGMDNIYLNLRTDKRTVQLFMPNLLSSHSIMPTNM